MKRYIKIFSGLCAVILLVMNIMTVNAFAASVNDVACSNGDKAYAIYLYNASDNKVIFEQNATSVISPASTVKLMTALVAFEQISDIKKEITITKDMISDINGNSLGFAEGEIVSYETLLIALVCGGYNDAAKALAVSTSGSVDAFVTKMNSKARTLGASNTLYTEPTGIDDNAKTTVYDTMLIAREFMKNSALLEYSSLPSYNINATNNSDVRLIYNRNALKSSYSTVKYLNPDALGMNAGMTSGGGYCVVTGVKNGGSEYICIVMGAKHGSQTDTTYSYLIANELISQITRLGDRLILSADTKVGELPIEGASLGKESISVRPAKNVYAYLPKDYEIGGLLEFTYVYSVDKVIAPVEDGNVVGKVVVSYDGEIVAITDLVIAETVERELVIYALFMIRAFLKSRPFALIILSLVVIIVVKLIISSRDRHKKVRYNSRRY